MLIESTSLSSIPLLFKALKAMTEFGYIVVDEKHIEFLTLSSLDVSCIRASFAREYFSTFVVDKSVVMTVSNKVLATTVKESLDVPGNSWSIIGDNNSSYTLVIRTAKRAISIKLNDVTPRYAANMIETFNTNFERSYTAAIKMDAITFANEIESYDDIAAFDMVISDDRKSLIFPSSSRQYDGNIVTIKTKSNTDDAKMWGSYDLVETKNIIEFVKRSRFFSFFVGNYIPIKYLIVVGNKNYVPSSFNDKKTNDFSITYYIAPRSSNDEVDDAFDGDLDDEPVDKVVNDSDEDDEDARDDDESRNYTLNESE